MRSSGDGRGGGQVVMGGISCKTMMMRSLLGRCSSEPGTAARVCAGDRGRAHFQPPKSITGRCRWRAGGTSSQASETHEKLLMMG